MGDAVVRKRRHARILVLAALVLVLGTLGSYRALSHQVADFRYYRLPTNSMAPTLIAGDSIRVDEAPGPKAPRRGEIWVFRMPPAAGAGVVAVKRVVAVPGDTVEVRAGVLVVNGRPQAEPYVRTPPSYTVAPRRLGPDDFYVLGDNRNTSHDSHAWGPLHRSYLMGRAQLRYWPPARIKGL